MSNSIEQLPRIVIYGVGQFGQQVAKLAAEKGWPIVAAYNRAGDKVGMDIGKLAGLGKDLGVIVQDCETADYGKLDADIAIVAISNRISEDMPAYERLLGAGLNVISLAGEACFPYGVDESLAARIDSLASANKVSFTGTGIWDMSRIWSGILLSGPCTEINALFHKSTTDLERVGKPAVLQGGVGLTQEQFSEAMKAASAAGGLYPTISQHVLTALGYTVTNSTERMEPVLFDEPVFCATLDKELPPGIVCGTRIISTTESKQGVTAEAQIELRVFKEGETEYMHWKVDGKPSCSIRIERDDSAHMTASSLLNRVKDVIAADPGIQLISQLGPMKHTALL